MREFEMLGRVKRLFKANGLPHTSDENGLPHTSDEKVPPAQLRKRVHGSEDLESFEQVGRAISTTLFDCLSRVEIAGSGLRVLDFGVGCGRVLSPLHYLCETAPFPCPIQWYGTDIDIDAIKWGKVHLNSLGEFFVNGSHPPLPFADQFFDFVYSISVFTHLPEDMQFSWLKEINRVLKPGGKAVLSAHPFGPARSFKEERLIAKGFHYIVDRKRTEGLPSFYQTSCHTCHYIEREWPNYMIVESIVEKGINNDQTLVLCRRAN
jgi:SAM-dependent methyltransferase